LIPLVAIPDLNMMEATICFTMLEHGFSMNEIRKKRRIPPSWTAKAIRNHVEIYGKAVHPENFYKL